MALPKAVVKGVIVVNGKEMYVNGIGYHDHNWNYSILTVMNYGRGWYWGKIRSESFVIVWANIIKPAKRSQLIAVVNQDKDGYLNINPKNIHFNVLKFLRKGYKKIPISFKLQIEDEICDKIVKVDVNMESQNFHYGKQLLAEAERICLEDFDKKNLFVLSGVGVKPYYRSLGYQNQGVYLGKQL